MHNSFKENWEYAKSFVPQIKRLLKENGKHIIKIKIAPKKEDMKYATDFKAEITGGGTIAVRVRDLKRMRDNEVGDKRDLTIRSKKDWGSFEDQELSKIRDKRAGRFYLYCWAEGKEITEWMLLCLNALRASELLEDERYDIPNGDGTYFRAYSHKELERANCILNSDVTLLQGSFM